jgi:hypothetical protein
VKFLSDYINLKIKYVEEKGIEDVLAKWIKDEGLNKLIIFSSKIIRSYLRLISKSLSLESEEIKKLDLEQLGVINNFENYFKI